MSESERKKKTFSVYRKRHIYAEWLSFFAIWVLFVVGIVEMFVFKGEDALIPAVLVVCGFIILFALLPFVLDVEFYLAIWRGLAKGKEVIFKAETKGSIFASSLLGSKEVWIEN